MSVLRTSDLDYDLPEDRIARVPAEPRDSARMMVVRASGEGRLEHRRVRDLPDYVQMGDCMVLNRTRVLPAHVEGVRSDTGGRVEGLYLSGGVNDSGERVWRMLLQGKRLRAGNTVRLTGPSGDVLDLVLQQRSESDDGAWRARVDGAPDETDPQTLARIGATPIPPYIRRARKHASLSVADSTDRERYQTVFAADTGASIAAPTAGLHFTPALLDRIRGKGVTQTEVTLHVGIGTFRPVEAEFIEQHVMHAESCSMPAASRVEILRTRAAGGRVLCVGTTAARTVETFARLDGADQAAPEWCDTTILITPGYQWRWTDALLTNFHLPRSTLMAMVASLLERGGNTGGGGVTRLRSLYDAALREGYRFYSYGDAMLILP